MSTNGASPSASGAGAGAQTTSEPPSREARVGRPATAAAPNSARRGAGGADRHDRRAGPPRSRAAAARGTRRPGTPRRGPRAGRPYSAPPRVPRRRPGCARRPRPSRPLPGHRIAIDARAAARPELGGVERWARELATRLPALGPTLRGPDAAARGSSTAPATRGSRSCCRARAARAGRCCARPTSRRSRYPRNVDRDPRRRRAAPSRVVLARLRRVAAARSCRSWPVARCHVVTVSEFSRGELVELLRARRTASPSSPAASTPRFTPDADAEPRARRARPHAALRPLRRLPDRAQEPAGARSAAGAAPTRSTSSSPAATGRSSRARRGSTRCATSAPCPTRCCPGSTRAPRRSRSRASTRASACRCSRRWRAARPSSPPTAPRCRRPPAGPPGSRRRTRWRAARCATLLDDEAEQASGCATPACERADGVHLGRPPREMDALLSRSSSPRRRAVHRQRPRADEPVVAQPPQPRPVERVRRPLAREPRVPEHPLDLQPLARLRRAASAPASAATPGRVSVVTNPGAPVGLALRRRPRQLGQPHRLAPVAVLAHLPAARTRSA